MRARLSERDDEALVGIARRQLPHVTLAYLHGATPEEVTAWAQPRHAFCSEAFWADSFHLYSSHSGKGPSRYVAEADYVLGASG